MEIFISIIVGIILGVGITTFSMWLIIRNEKRQHVLLENEIDNLRSEKDTLTRQEASTAAQLMATQQTLALTKEQANKDAEAQQKVFQTELHLARESMRAQFEKEMLERTEQLKKANTENMQQVVTPLKRELDLLRELVAQSKESSDKNTASLAQSIKTIIEHDQERDKTTQTLANALKNRGKVQGDWGEQVLTNILQDSGLREGEEYFVQDNVKDEEGKNRRPDVIGFDSSFALVIIFSANIIRIGG